ncbi:MAG: flavin reductase family protein [Chloroflexota bacterium]
MSLEERKQVLRLFTYGLHIIGVRQGDQVNGFTVNWLTQVSFDPLLVAVSVENEAWSWPILKATRQFTINVLATGQRELAGRLGKSRRKINDKFESIAWQPSPMTQCPVLYQDALAYVECQIQAIHPAGDSHVIIAEVIATKQLKDGIPLTMKEAGFRHAG